MIPKILHHSSHDLTWEERKLIARARRIMPDWQFILWDDADNLNLVHEIIPHHAAAYQELPVNVMRVDIARYLYMYKFGGIYADTDYVFLRALDNDMLSKQAILGNEENFITNSGRIHVGNALLGSQPGLKVWLDMVDLAFENSKNPALNVESTTGPNMLRKFIYEDDKIKDIFTVYPPEVFYPDLAWGRLLINKSPRTIGGHMCWGSWRHRSFLKRVRNFLRRKITAFGMVKHV